jgi:hypothetical protein
VRHCSGGAGRINWRVRGTSGYDSDQAPRETRTECYGCPSKSAVFALVILCASYARAWAPIHTNQGHAAGCRFSARPARAKGSSKQGERLRKPAQPAGEQATWIRPIHP